MAKRSTWNKRANQARKEEHLAMGGNTRTKKHGVKSDAFKGGVSSDEPKGPRTRGGQKDSSAPKGHFNRKMDDNKFKSSGNANRRFREGDRKSSHGKFLNDQHFEGFKDRGNEQDDLIRLNKYLSIAGICSRREADKFIADGLVEVNGNVVTALGTKVKQTDIVKYAGEAVRAETVRYLLLNKPKDCITTMDDERGRETVVGLVKNACKERVYPVGRLDRNTTGLLLLTNDGDISKKLTHPSHEVRKVYHVILDKPVTKHDLKKLQSGVELEDGIAKADVALYVGDGSVREEVGVEIHSGRNRIVRRMFEGLGYKVERLDRVVFAGLSKKGLPRGRWRFLTEKEVSYLKML